VIQKRWNKKSDAEMPTMDRNDNLKVVDKLECEVEGIAKDHKSSDWQASFDDLSRGMPTVSRQR
jgi:hypothetical protein